jgi:hypothetical protein
MRYLILLPLFFYFKISYGQDSTYSSVIVHKDVRVDLMVKKAYEVNTAIKKASSRTMRGYRLMVLNTIKREEAIEAKTKIYTYFPDLKAYLIYQSPFFKLKAGNFRTKDEAMKYQKDLSVFFPKGVFIINDIIEIRPEKDSE